MPMLVLLHSKVIQSSLDEAIRSLCEWVDSTAFEKTWPKESDSPRKGVCCCRCTQQRKSKLEGHRLWRPKRFHCFDQPVWQSNMSFCSEQCASAELLVFVWSSGLEVECQYKSIPFHINDPWVISQHFRWCRSTCTAFLSQSCFEVFLPLNKRKL